jgi:SAM-dependent methyltransferase
VSLEITDVIVDYDADTLERRPVRKEDATRRLAEASASRFALACVAAIRERDGYLDADHVDELMIQAHAEMQRLWETLLHGARVAQVLEGFVAAARAAGVSERLRVVDVGCGCGYVLRWLAANQVLAEDVELIGVDYNAALIRKATQLAEREGLPCRFRVANAFRLAEPAHVFLSTGVIHHFAASDLEPFFASQARSAPLAFAHFDARKSWAAPLGAWLFHKAKFRLKIGQHDGYLSAVRAHETGDLLRAARRSSTGMKVGEFNRRLPALFFLRVMHAVIGLREDLARPFTRGFRHRSALSELS